MNVRPGDIAVIVRSDTSAEHIGRLVDVLHPGSEPGYWRVRVIGSPLRVMDQDWRWMGSVREFNARDRSLKPIRPQPDEARDETLTWPCGNPNDRRTDRETPAEHAERLLPDYLTGQGA